MCLKPDQFPVTKGIVGGLQEICAPFASGKVQYKRVAGRSNLIYEMPEQLRTKGRPRGAAVNRIGLEVADEHA